MRNPCKSILELKNLYLYSCVDNWLRVRGCYIPSYLYAELGTKFNFNINSRSKITTN